MHFLAHTCYEIEQGNHISRYINIIMQAYVSAQRLEESSDMTIDHVFEKILEENYKKLGNIQKRACHC